MRLEKQELRTRWRELRTLVNEWDPIGLIADGAPPDEYECVVGPLLRMLEEKASPTEITGYLSREFEDHFGLAADNTEEFTTRVAQWYRQNWPETTAG
jgi:hypothetical protein